MLASPSSTFARRLSPLRPVASFAGALSSSSYPHPPLRRAFSISPTNSASGRRKASNKDHRHAWREHLPQSSLASSPPSSASSLSTPAGSSSTLDTNNPTPTSNPNTTHVIPVVTDTPSQSQRDARKEVLALFGDKRQIAPELQDQMLLNVSADVGGEYGDFVRIVEQGPRLGLLTNKMLKTDERVKFIDELITTGLKAIECGSFAHHMYQPQLANTHEVIVRVHNWLRDLHLSVQVEDPAQLEKLLKAIQYEEHHHHDNMLGKVTCDEISVYVGCTEPFSVSTLNSEIRPRIEQMRDIVFPALKLGFRVRACLGATIECPFEGPVPPERVADIAQEMVEMGCYEVSLADTTGRGDPATVRRLIETVAARIGVDKIAGHFNDTFGTGMANVLTALTLGVRSFDTTVAGIASCPYSPGAISNIATEDVVYTLHNLGYHTSINLLELSKVGGAICETLDTPNRSRAGAAVLARISWELDEQVAAMRKAKRERLTEVWRTSKGSHVLAICGLAILVGIWGWREYENHPEVKKRRIKEQNERPHAKEPVFSVSDLILEQLKEEEEAEQEAARKIIAQENEARDRTSKMVTS